MRIALIGYGKMGRELEKEALKKGHDIVMKIDSSNVSTLTPSSLSGTDVAIEFSTPSSVVSNIKICLDGGIPVIVGTTGWYDQIEEVKNLCAEKNGTMMFASNFSIGVNIFFELNRALARMMENAEGYQAFIREEHHILKKDKPSGTAITLAEDIIKLSKRYNEWKLLDSRTVDRDSMLAVHAHREGDIKGTHVITYESANDAITISHEAFNREGFAAGAIEAAEWLQGKSGFFNISDMLNFNFTGQQNSNK